MLDMVIVAPVDKSERSITVVREAQALAEAFCEEIHVVHVMSRSEFVELGSRRAESANPIDMSEVRETATEVAEDAARAIDDSVAVVGLEGEPAEEVVSYAADHDARYIVVSTQKRSPAGKALFGSVAQSILLNAECPVVSAVQSESDRQ